MLRTLPEDWKSKWKDSVNKFVLTYSWTVNEATGFSPFLLIFGRSPRLSVDLLFGTSAPATKRSYTEFAKRSAMKDAYTKANANSSGSASAAKKIYDRKVSYTDLKQGDRVLVRNLTERGGPGKLRSY